MLAVFGDTIRRRDHAGIGDCSGSPESLKGIGLNAEEVVKDVVEVAADTGRTDAPRPLQASDEDLEHAQCNGNNPHGRRPRFAPSLNEQA
jgi:hypothetical protein